MTEIVTTTYICNACGDDTSQDSQIVIIKLPCGATFEGNLWFRRDSDTRGSAHLCHACVLGEIHAATKEIKRCQH